MLNRRLTFILTTIMLFSMAGIIFNQYLFMLDTQNAKKAILEMKIEKSLQEASQNISKIIDQNIDSQLQSFSIKRPQKKSQNRNYRSIQENYKSNWVELDDPVAMFNTQMATFNQTVNIILNSLFLNPFESTQNLAQKILSNVPISKLVSKEKVLQQLQSSLSQNKIPSFFEYGLTHQNKPTKIQSEQFIKTNAICLSLSQKNILNEYQLCTTVESFEELKKENIFGNAILSIVLIGISLGIFFAFIFFIFKQQRLSDLKTSFINNMTHELKTPLITIRLAATNMINPRNIDKPEKLEHYAKVIHEENDRMKQQIDNILQLAKLEGSTLILEKEELSIHELLEKIISHISLRIQQRNGILKTHYNATEFLVFVDDFHMFNSFFNILDNSIKYSPEKLEIRIDHKKRPPRKYYHLHL